MTSPRRLLADHRHTATLATRTDHRPGRTAPPLAVALRRRNRLDVIRLAVVMVGAWAGGLAVVAVLAWVRR